MFLSFASTLGFVGARKDEQGGEAFEDETTRVRCSYGATQIEAEADGVAHGAPKKFVDHEMTIRRFGFERSP